MKIKVLILLLLIVSGAYALKRFYVYRSHQAFEQLKSDEKEADLINSQKTLIPADTLSEIALLDEVPAGNPQDPAVAGLSIKDGYSYQYVSTEKGKFGIFLVKWPLSKVTVKTVAANPESCKNNCPTKPLAQYIKENGAFAGINGAYFCPPDYASCKGKTNSSDYAFYNTNRGKWMNKNALKWNKTGLMTFNGTSAKFYKDTSTYGNGGVSAGISNYPSLVKDGNVVINTKDLTVVQKTVKGLRGFIAVSDSYIYIGHVSNATVIEEAYAVRALGVKHALNLDGGGSSALYADGYYKIGPGRGLPNAIVLVEK